MIEPGPDTAVGGTACAEQIDRADAHARSAAREVLSRGAATGRLGELAIWLAGVRGGPPVTPFGRAQLMLLGAEASTATARVLDAYGIDARMIRVTGRDAEARTAGGTSTAPVDSAPVDTAPVDTAPVDAAPVDTAPVDTARVTTEIDAGRAEADASIDAGADVLLLAAPGGHARTAAATVVAVVSGGDATSVTGGPDLDDAAWVAAVTAVRDTLRRARRAAEDPTALLAAVGAGQPAVLTGIVLRAASRRVPVVLDGLVPLTAALLAGRIAARSADWCRVAHPGEDPAGREALRRLGTEAVLDMGLRAEDGLAAALTVPMMTAAAALLAG